MKKATLIVSVSLLLALSIGMVIYASEPPENTTCVGYCKEYAEADGLSYGKCVSMCNSCFNNGKSDAVCTCNVFVWIGWIGEDGLFPSFGKCVKFFATQD